MPVVPAHSTERYPKCAEPCPPVPVKGLWTAIVRFHELPVFAGLALAEVAERCTFATRADVRGSKLLDQSDRSIFGVYFDRH